MTVKKNDIVLLDPLATDNPMFAGCLMVVTEVKSWGVQGYVQGLGYAGHSGGTAYYRASTGKFIPTGGRINPAPASCDHSSGVDQGDGSVVCPACGEQLVPPDLQRPTVVVQLDPVFETPRDAIIFEIAKAYNKAVEDRAPFLAMPLSHAYHLIKKASEGGKPA